ncbi:MAG: hypothetical protein A3E79_08875 [Burkholderiales bacterium RIFCSPHIGHO2_12_FULL_61_11]|nr:MAG: hypothetical protein A3E79_08875 [Burkholderiales bacterium RIFCSPHIGHO2_12_FULL_61_11]
MYQCVQPKKSQLNHQKTQVKKDLTPKQVYEIVALSELCAHPANPRKGDIAAIRESIGANGFYGAVVAQRSTGHVLAGNHRLLAAQYEGLTELPVIWLDVDDDRALKILLADNRTNDVAGYDDAALAALLKSLKGDLGGSGYDDESLEILLADLRPAATDAAKGKLSERFGVPPFTVLDARQGYWQERKQAWLALGIQSEIGRGGGEKLTMSHTVQRLKPRADQAAARQTTGRLLPRTRTAP